MKKYIYFLIVLMSFISCANNSSKLEISQFEIKDKNGVTGIFVTENGQIKIMDEVIGKIYSTGEIFDKSNKIIAKIDANDNLRDTKGNILCNIDKNGNIDNGSGKLIGWTENGEWPEGNQEISFKIHPNNQSLYRTASCVIFLYFESAKQ